MSIKLQQLMNFVMVVEEGGFRAASYRANRSQAALSTSIKELEKILGQTLFEPGNKTKLTPFGEICLPKVVQFLNIYSALNNDLKAAAVGQQGRVRIASIPSVAAQFIPNILSLFCENYPNVEVSLVDDNAVGVESRLIAGEVDIALGNPSQLHYKEINFTPLISDPIGIVCLKSNPIAKHTNGIDWESALGHTFIRNGTCRLLEPTPARQLVENALYSVENITSLFSVLKLGIGITTLPKLAFPNNVDELTWIPLSTPLIKRNIGIFTLKARTSPPQVQAFKDLCTQYLNHKN